ncbi:hypothetical protein PYW08_013360 [Mythimna loreyi]|uniref:Uncharacterized protein n=1 Tax=Mythimna loreyi TaxID=667449 RepID=A0ACC2QFG4_9NEOP|nr:hypothetical protein PYW08_013360 [Mythimna loreyi]
MFIPKQVVVFLILQNIISTFCEPVPVDVFSGDSEYTSNDELPDYSMEYDDYLETKDFSTYESDYDSNDYIDDYVEDDFENNTNEIKSEFYINSCRIDVNSLISQSDIKYLIEDKAETLKIKEKVLFSYYDVEKVFKKYMGELEEFQKRFIERPGHMLHVLRSMASLREQLEPGIEELAAHLDQLETLEENFNDAAKGAVVVLNHLEKYKKICHINCEEIHSRFGHENETTYFSLVEIPNGMYCVNLKHLNDYIIEKLREIEAQYDDGLRNTLDFSEKMYENKIFEFKNNLKDAAVKQFGTTMYDILSLQDDYHHVRTALEHVNVSSEIIIIMENNAEIGFKLIGLKRDLKKYRRYCMKCGNVRMKRHTFDEYDEPRPGSDDEENTETDRSSVDDAVDELVQSKVDEIKKSIESNFITMLVELIKYLEDPDVIDNYVSDLHPIQIVIKNEIKKEQEALLRLRNSFPEELINKILVLSKESTQMVQNLESAKQFIDQAMQV